MPRPTIIAREASSRRASLSANTETRAFGRPTTIPPNPVRKRPVAMRKAGQRSASSPAHPGASPWTATGLFARERNDSRLPRSIAAGRRRSIRHKSLLGSARIANMDTENDNPGGRIGRCSQPIFSINHGPRFHTWPDAGSGRSTALFRDVKNFVNGGGALQNLADPVVIKC
jgi:hypothetical protein